MLPADLLYTAQHEWLAVQPDGTVRVGITDFAQDSLGDIVFVALPGVGDDVAAGQAMGEVESTKSVSEVYAPLAGRISRRNDAVETAPETINDDPYGEGWLVEIEPVAEVAAAEFLDVAGYEAVIKS
ncbi:MAG: glycine cleavage system protein GcvH [Actinobacteria bacterium]|nr:glycine cleavage system protein GcvH [Actinomycetota bacterium]